ncbi:MAG TPA: protein kinase [Polyangiaceae bacterium]|nr:protein kinase [Polyangiaceae bacterium]
MTTRGDERRIGEIVGGKYRVVRFLAAGGMGVVFEAQHTVVKRRFAVKFLRPELAEKRESLARFQREAQAAGALESEHLAAAVDFGIAADGSPFIVMEYLSGESVEALLAREGQLPVERATDLVLQACRGIQAAHAAGIVHRDLKPQNLYLCRREDRTDLLKVLDFGIAKLEAADQNSAATLTGTLLGTPAYMAPEQARGDKTIDHRADIYALGAIAYELLSGEKPHPGDSHNAVLHHIATQPAVPLDSVAKGVPKALSEAISRALESDPSARFPSADAFAQALTEFARRTPWPVPEHVQSSPAHEGSAPPGLAEDATVPADISPASLTEQPSKARRPRPGGALVLVLGALISLGVWLWSRNGEETRSALPPRAPEPLPIAPADVRVNAAESPLPATSPATELAPSAEPVARKPEPSRLPQAKREPTVPARAPARPEKTLSESPTPAAASAPPLAFDRKNPYD